MKLFLVLFLLWGNSECSKILAGRKGITKLDIEEGETLTLTCKADPDHIRTYRWVYIRETQKPRVRVLSSGRRLVVGEPRFSIKAERNGKIVDITLKLKEIRPYETGLFMCWKQNKKPDPQVYVRVLEKGFTEAVPKSAEISGPNYISFGNQATIKCIIRPTLSGKVIWTKDGNVLQEADQSYKQSTSVSNSGEVLATLDIITARENGKYTCTTDTDPPTAATFVLIVKVAKVESLVIEPQKNDIYYRDSVTVTCVVSGTKDEILWMRDKSFIFSNETEDKMIQYSSILENGSKKSELVIRSFAVEDNGQYVCYIPGDSKYIHINIEGRAPRLVGEMSWQFLPGSVLQFSCKIQYTKGQKVVTWLFDDAELPADWYFREISHEEYKNITNFQLDISVLPGTLAQYIGVYTCSTPFVNTSTSIYELVPLIIGDSPPERIEVLEGEQFSVHCSIFGYIAPMVYWEKFMDDNWKMVEETTTEGSLETLGVEIRTKFLQFENNTMGEHQELIVSKVLPRHAGKYQCKATNERDTVMLSTQVDVIELLARVIGMTADEITEGKDMIITCSVQNWKESVDFIKGLTVIDPKENPRYSIVLADNTDKINETSNSTNFNTFILTITKATIDDQGFYECYAGNESSDSVVAIVNPNPPDIIEIAASPAFEESDLFISCTITNMPLDEMVIFNHKKESLNNTEDGRLSVHVADISGERSINQQRIADQVTYVLKIQKLRMTDSGEYHCMLGPNYEHVKATVYIDVEEVDKGEDILLEISSSKNGEDLILNCTVTKWNGQVSFFHNETLLLEEDGRFELRKVILETGTSHLLQRSRWSEKDAGRYQCFTTPFAYADMNVTSDQIIGMFPIFNFPTSLDFKQLIELPSETTSPKLSLQCLSPGVPQETLFTHDGIIFAQSDPKTGDFVHSRATLTHLGAKDGFTSGLQLTLDSIDSEDLGYWHCTTRYSESNRVLNASLTVEIYVPAKFTEVPEREINVVPGSTLVLDCAASGLPMVQVDWFKKNISGVLQSGKEYASLQIANFSAYDEGTYLCRATNEYELLEYQTILSLDKSLRIIDMPPPEVIVEYGDDVDLTCISTGSISPTVDWLKDSDEQTPLMSGLDFVTLIIRNVTVNDLGVYTCRATLLSSVVNKRTRLVLPMESNVFSTTINAPTLLMGRLVHFSGPYDVEVGNNFTITCLVSPLLDLYVAVIVYNDFIISVGEDVLSSDPRVNVTTGYGGMGERLYKLTVSSAREMDSGFYECQVNTKPLARHVHHINVVPEGMLPQQIGSTDDLALVTPEPTQESFQSTSVTDYSDRNISQSSVSMFDSILIKEKVLDIQPAVIKENVSTILHSTEDVIPVIIERIGPMFASLGDTIKIPCTTTSLTMPIIWFEEKRQRLLFVDELDVGQNPRIKLEESLKKEINGKTKTLVIEDLKEEDAGNYTCSIPHNDTTTASIELCILDLEDIMYTDDFNGTHEEQIPDGEIKTTTEEPQHFQSTSAPLSFTTKSADVKYIGVNLTKTQEKDERQFVEVISTTEKYADYYEEEDRNIYAGETNNNTTVATEDPIWTEVDHEMDHSYDESEVNYSDIYENDDDEKEDYSEIDDSEDHIEFQEVSVDQDEESSSSESTDESDIDVSVSEETDNPDVYKEFEKVDVAIKSESDTEEMDNDENDINEYDGIDHEFNEIEYENLFPKEIDNGISIAEYTINKEYISETIIPIITVSPNLIDLTEDVNNESFIVTYKYQDAETPFKGETVFINSETEVYTENITATYEASTISAKTDSDITIDTALSPDFTPTSEGYIHVPEIIRTTMLKSIDGPTTTSGDVEPPTTSQPELTSASEGYRISPFDEIPEEKYKHPLFISTPGEDIVVSKETEVRMTCPTKAVTEDITWKSEEKLLFLGSLDLAGVDGIQLTESGQLRLLTGSPEIKNSVSYTCFVYDYENYQDVAVMSYHVDLDDAEVIAPKALPFYGPNWYSAVVAPSSKYSSQVLSDLLQDKGLVTRPIDITNCSLPDYIEGLDKAQHVLENCLTELREIITNDSIFVLLEVLATIPFGGKYATSLMYVSNSAEDISVHMYGAMTPLISNRNLIDIQCGTAIYEHDLENKDLKKKCKQNIEKSLSILWESYKTKINL